MNDFVKLSTARTSRRGLHYSVLFGRSYVQKAMECAGTACRLQRVGYSQGGRWKDQAPVSREVLESAGDEEDGDPRA